MEDSHSRNDKLFKNCLAFYEIRNFITVVTRVPDCTHIQLIPLHAFRPHFSLKPILILSPRLLLCLQVVCLFLSVYQTKFLWISELPHACYMTGHDILLISFSHQVHDHISISFLCHVNSAERVSLNKTKIDHSSFRHYYNLRYMRFGVLTAE
jgi:uncharacterized membrane protein